MKVNYTLKLFFFLLLMFPAISQAHTGSMRGYVYDVNTHKPIEGVNIYIKTSNSSTITDAFGGFFMKGLKDGKCTLLISHLGYETIEQQVKIEDGVTSDLSINLSPAPVQMKDVSVNAGKSLNMNAVNGLDLKTRPVNSTQDLMRLVPGLFTAQHQGGGKAEQIFLRGFDADHGTDVNVSVDGMPVNMVSHAHGQGFADSHFIIPELVQELDYGKGPYEISKGDFATAGWVAFKTKNYLDNDFIKTDVGSFGYFRLVGGINLFDQNTGNQEAYIAGEYGYNRSYFDLPQNFNRFNLVGKYTNHISDKKILTITLSGFHSNWNASGQVPQRAISKGLIGRYGGLDPEGGVTSRYNANVQYYQAINPNTYIKSNIYASYYQFSLYSDFTYFLKDSVNGDQIHQAENRFLTGSNNELCTNYTLRGFRMKTQFGVGFRYDDIMNDELSHTADKSILLNNIALGNINEANIYGYVNQTIYLLPQLVVNAGTRFDYFAHTYDNKLSEENNNTTYNTHAFSPKFGAYYNFGNKARLYFNYGVGFHSNDTRTVALANVTQTPLSYVLPLAHSTDLGITIKPVENLLLSAAIWQLNLQQEFTYGGDESNVQPSGKTTRKGFDISLRYEPFKWLYIDGDFNYSYACYVDSTVGNNHVPLAAPFTSIGGISFKITKSLTTGLRYRYIADRPANNNNSIIAPGYTVFDAVISYSKPKYELGMQVQNLFNTQWNEASFATETRLRNETEPVTELCFTPGTPLFLKLSATYKF